MLHVFWELSLLKPPPLLPAHSHSQHQQRTAPSRRQGAAIVISDRQEQFRIGKYPSRNDERDIPHFLPRSEVSSYLSDHRTGCSQCAEALGLVTATSLPTHPMTVWLLLPWARRTALGLSCACPAQAELPPSLL